MARVVHDRPFTVRILGGLFPMYPLTISGIERAVRKLTRGT